MDVGSPDNAFDDINHFLKDDDTTFSDDIDLDFIVDKDIAENCVYGDLSVNGNFHLDLTEQNEQDPPSHSPSFIDQDNLVCSSQNINSSVLGGFQNDKLSENETIVNPEKLHVQSNENVRNEDSETLCNSYLHESIFQMDSSPILHEIQNDVSALPHELVSMEDTNFQDILPKSVSLAHNEIGEDSYIEVVQNEPTQSEYACRDADEEIPVGETGNLSFSPSWSRDPETKSENINELRKSPYGKDEFEHSIVDQESPGRSSEVCKSPNTNGEIFSSDIRELPGSPPDYQVIPNSPSLLKQTSSTTECNQEKEQPSQDHVPHTEPPVSVSPLDLGQKHTENSPAEHFSTSPKIFNRVEEAMQRDSRNTSCFRDEMEQCNIPDSRSSPDTQSNHMSFESGPLVSHSPKSQEACSLDDILMQSSCSPTSSNQKNMSPERSNSRCSKSPCARNSIKGSPQARSLKSEKLSASQECTMQAPSSSMHKHEKVKMSNCRRSRSRSPYDRGCHSKSFESPQLPPFKPSEHNVSRSRSPSTRECHNRSLEKTSREQLSQPKRSNMQDSTRVSSYSRSDNQKNESDNNKSNYNRLYSRSSCRENYNKRSLHEDSSAGRFSRKVSELQEDNVVSSYSRTSKMKSISIDTYTQKRSRSRSPDTRDFSNKSMRTAPLTVEFPNRHRLSVTGESLLQPSSSRSSKKTIESPERSNLGKEFGCSDSVKRKHSASPRSTITRQRSTKGVEKRLLSSPRRHYAHHNYHSRGRRSISPTHTRQKDFSSGYKGDVRNRYRSRSPYIRDNGMRSPRRRRSSRHRSPSPGDYSLRSTSRRTHWSPPQDRSTGLGQPGRDLFIAGFNFTTTERDLERKFSRFGRVRDVRIVRDKRSGDSRGFGFLTLERDEQADAAIRALDKTEWGGRIVLVEKTKSH